MINLIMTVMSKRLTDLTDQHSNNVEITRQSIKIEVKL